MRNYQVISADGHLEVPLDLSTRVPARYADKAPKLVRNKDGSEVWVMDEWTRDNVGNLYCGLPYDQFTRSSAPTYHFADGSPRPGTGDAAQRLREQDADGLDAEVLFPPVYGQGLMRKMIPKDPACYRAIVQAYNNFVAEFCGRAPDRLIGIAMMPETGVADAVDELVRCRQMGLRAAALSMWPNGSPDPIPEQDERFWATALDIDMKMTPHGSFGGPIKPYEGVSREAAVCASGALGWPCTGTIGRLMLYVFDKFPALRFYFAETQGAWLAHALNWMDEFYLRWYRYHDIHLKKMPSQYYRDHCRFSFIHDRVVMQLRQFIDPALLMWGTDFPHSIGSFPDSRRVLDELFDGVPDEVRRQVLVDNVCDFFDLDPARELTPTPR
ncbi:MAG TPA: amidohydrolase family protein [Candidatus Binataceae bacterium]